MISELYSGGILEAAAAIPPARRLERPPATSTKVSRVCGSEVTVDLNLEGEIVTDFAMEARACALGQASASIVARNIIGATADELMRLREEMRAMLKEGGAAPTGERWSELSNLLPIRDYPQRHASTLLVFEAVVDCIEQIRETRANSA